VLDAVVAELAGHDLDQAAQWQRLLEEFFEAILERALDVSMVDLPPAHPFWGAFTSEQGRQILRALASLGYRFDGLGGWLDGRVPSKRELSLAVGYAGLEPVRIRNWPTPTEIPSLFGEATIAAHEYLALVAPSLTVGELASELATHAGNLAELWSEWERVRPLLLAES
jgi:hypothetical protein